MSAENSKSSEDGAQAAAVIIAVIVFVVMLGALFTGIVQGIVMLFEHLMPFLLFFCCAVLLLILIVFTLLTIFGVRQAAKGELGTSLHDFSRGLRGLPTRPRLAYAPRDPADDPYTIDAVPGNVASTSTDAAFRTATEVPPSPDPSSDSKSDEQNEILLLHADALDLYVQHMDRIATIYRYENFLADIDSTLCLFAESYRGRLEEPRSKIELALKIATIIDLREEVVCAYDSAPHAIREKLPKHIVRDHIHSVYRKRFPLDLIKKRHRALLQKIEFVSLQVKETIAKERQAHPPVDQRALTKRRQREALERACKQKAEENVRRAMPSTPRELVDDLVIEETKRLVQNALQHQQEQGDSDDRTSEEPDNLAA